MINYNPAFEKIIAQGGRGRGSCKHASKGRRSSCNQTGDLGRYSREAGKGFHDLRNLYFLDLGYISEISLFDCISHVAKLLNSKSTNAILLSGAGVSTASGIPDFRSAGGMYDTLQPELLTASETEKALMERDPTYVVSWDIFKDN